MTTLTIYLDNEKSEQAIKAVMDALGLEYDEVSEQTIISCPVLEGVRKAQEDWSLGHVEDYKGLNAILNQ